MGSAAAVPPSGAAPDTPPAWYVHGSGRWREAGGLENLGWPVLSGPTYTRPLLPPDDPKHKPTSTTRKQSKKGCKKSKDGAMELTNAPKFN